MSRPNGRSGSAVSRSAIGVAAVPDRTRHRVARPATAPLGAPGAHSRAVDWRRLPHMRCRASRHRGVRAGSRAPSTDIDPDGADASVGRNQGPTTASFGPRPSICRRSRARRSTSRRHATDRQKPKAYARQRFALRADRPGADASILHMAALTRSRRKRCRGGDEPSLIGCRTPIQWAERSIA